jgi:heat shock protein HtpX
VADGIANAIALIPSLAPVAVIASLVWFAIAYFANQWIIDAATGAEEVSRASEPRLWNLLENLCISRGLRVPALRIIEDNALNAYASGIREGRYSITVTRGLLEALDDAELEAVLGHELTHIRNRDVQLLVVCAVFVGIISLVADILFRSPSFFANGGGGWSGGGGYRGGSSRRESRGGGGGGAIILILIAIAIFILARVLAVALRMAVSRKREFLADAGSVDLTKNPDAMISALRKIEGRSALEAPAQIKPMFIDLPVGAGLSGLFATHPSIEARVKALVEYAGGHDPGPMPLPSPATLPPAHAPSATATGGPWGQRHHPGPWDHPGAG